MKRECTGCGFHIVDARSDGLCTDCYFDELEAKEWQAGPWEALGRAFVMRERAEQLREHTERVRRS